MSYSTTGFFCGNYTGGDARGIAVADDFIVPSGQIWYVQTIRFVGASFSGLPDANTQSWEVTFYRDGAIIYGTLSGPGTTLQTYNILPANGLLTLQPTFIFDSDLVLLPGRYWVTIVPTIASSFNNQQGFAIRCLNTAGGYRGRPIRLFDRTGVVYGVGSRWIGLEALSDWNTTGMNIADYAFQLGGNLVYSTTGSVSTAAITSGMVTSGPLTSSPLTTSPVSTGSLSTAVLTTNFLTTSLDNTGNANSEGNSDSNKNSGSNLLVAVLGSLMGIIVLIVIVIVILLFVFRGRNNRKRSNSDIRQERLAELKAMSSRAPQPDQASTQSLPPPSKIEAPPPNPSLAQASASPYQLMAPGQTTTAEEPAYSVSPISYANPGVKGAESPYSQHPPSPAVMNSIDSTPRDYHLVPPTSASSSTYQPIPNGNSKEQIPQYNPKAVEEKLPFEIDHRELIIEKEIGRGAYGAVFKGKWRGGTVAIKQLLLQSELTEKELRDFKEEAKVMARLRPHVNVVQFLGITVAPAPLCIVTEFMDQGSLYNFLRGNSKIDSNMLMNLVKGISAGMLHLHKENIIHRDLASRNILLGSGFQVKISDFGLSRVAVGDQSNKTTSDTGPLKWMSPEAIRNRVYSKASDIWSFGVTLWEILCRRDPYENLDPVQTALEVTHNKLRLVIPDYAPPVIKEVMIACFQDTPESRPSFSQITDRLQSARLDEWMVSSKEDEDVYGRSPANFADPPPDRDNLSVSAHYKTFSDPGSRDKMA